MRRIALISDIHGNLAALEAVLGDISDAAVDETYCLGDLIGYGPRPNEVVELIRSSAIPTIPGNYDAGVSERAGGCGCFYATDTAREDGARSYEFTEHELDEPHAEWLRSLPTQRRIAVGDARALLVHGSPRKNNEYLFLDRTEQQLARLALDAETHVVLHGHIHVPYHRAFDAGESGYYGAQGTIHYVSSGSVGKPKDGDSRAGWVEVFIGDEADVRAATSDPSIARIGRTSTWLGIEVHRVAYDIEAVAAEMLAAGLPASLGEALRHA